MPGASASGSGATSCACPGAAPRHELRRQLGPAVGCRGGGSGSPRRPGPECSSETSARIESGKPAPAVGGEGDAGRHVVEAQRHRDRGGRRFVAGFVAQPEREGVGAGVRARVRCCSWARPRPAANSHAACRSRPARRSAMRRRRSGWRVPGRGSPRRGRSRSPAASRRRPAAPGRAGEPERCCRSGPSAPAVQPTLPAKSVAQWRAGAGPSLKAVVAIACDAATPSSQGRIRRRPPLAADLQRRARVFGQRDPGAVEEGFAEAHPAAGVGAGDLQGLGAAPPAGRRRARRRSTAAGAASSSSVIVSARNADHDPGSRLQDLLSARAQSRRSSSAGCAGGEAGDEIARGDVGRRGRGEDVEAAVPVGDPDALLDAVVERVPPGPADPGDRRSPAAPASASARSGCRRRSAGRRG